MTNRNRRSFGRPGRRTSGRHARLVWVNENVNEIVVPNTKAARDLLTAAKDFMTFDTTIIETIVTDLTWSFDSIAPSGKRQMRLALQIAPSAMDSDDFSFLFADSVGSPWMGVFGETRNLSGVQTQNFEFTKNGVLRFSSKRRFRENESTLFLIYQSLSPAVDTSNTLDGMIRTLLRIP